MFLLEMIPERKILAEQSRCLATTKYVKGRIKIKIIILKQNLQNRQHLAN
jgi:hypothetical protein